MPVTDLGLVRLAPTTPGSNKLFAFGPNFSDRSYTDDESQYFEMWGGVNAGFWPEDDIIVPVGQTVGWQESWWPLAQLGGLTWANEQVSIYLNTKGDTHTLTALVSQPSQGNITISAGNTLLLTEPFSANPAAPLHWDFPTAEETLNIQITDNNGNLYLEYQDKP